MTHLFSKRFVRFYGVVMAIIGFLLGYTTRNVQVVMDGLR